MNLSEVEEAIAKIIDERSAIRSEALNSLNDQEYESLGFNEKKLIKFYLACGNALVFQKVVAFFKAELKIPTLTNNFWNEFTKKIDQGNSSMEQWICALVWSKHSVKIESKNLQNSLSYLSCCDEYKTLKGDTRFLIDIARGFEI